MSTPARVSSSSAIPTTGVARYPPACQRRAVITCSTRVVRSSPMFACARRSRCCSTSNGSTTVTSSISTGEAQAFSTTRNYHHLGDRPIIERERCLRRLPRRCVPTYLMAYGRRRSATGSAAADQPGTRNYMGVKSGAVDAMIAALLKAEDRGDFVAAVRALDRVLISGFYVIPLFYLPAQWIARWTTVGRPAVTSLYGYLP